MDKLIATAEKLLASGNYGMALILAGVAVVGHVINKNPKT